MGYLIKNKKGLFLNKAVVKVIATEEELAKIKLYLEKIPEKERSKYENVVKIIQSLPENDGYSVRLKTYTMGYSWVWCGSFVNNSKEHIFSSIEECGWKEIEEVSKNIKLINKLFNLVKIAPLGHYDLDGCNSILKRMNQAEVKFEKFEKTQGYGEGESYAIFLENGYLDSKGFSGPLTRARMFESAEAANRARKAMFSNSSRGVIVKISLQAENVCDSYPLTNNDDLNCAISAIEAKKIKLFLEKATLEQLTEKVKILQEKLVNNDNSQKEINEDINRKMRKKL